MPKNFAELVRDFINLLELLIPLIFAVSSVWIIWKVLDAWIISGGDPKKITEGKDYALWGVIVLAVMASVWGIVALLQRSIFI